jgi:hypothetical protein
VTSYVQRTELAGKSWFSSLGARLKAQMLATALNTCYAVPGATTHFDLTVVCPPGGSACENVSRAFNQKASMTVWEMLGWPGERATAGRLRWYGNTQSLIAMTHDVFPAINGQTAFGW